MAKRKRSAKVASAAQRRRRPANPGLPDPQTVVSEQVLVSPTGRRYRVLRTTEKDPYDPPEQPGKSRPPPRSER